MRCLYHILSFLSFLVVCSALILLGIEGALRFYFTHFGTEEERIKYLYSGEDIALKNAVYIGLPYLNYGLAPAHKYHNSLGYRGAEITQPKPAGVYRIVALGGSTTYGFYQYDNAETWPAQLERILREDYGYADVEVINAGVPEYTTWESLVNLQFRVLDLNPDLVIVYDSTNDITFRLIQPEHYDGLNRARGLWRTIPMDLGPSVLWRFVAVNRGWMEDPRGLTTQFEFDVSAPNCPYHIEKDCFEYTTEALMRLNPPIYYERNIRNMVAVAQANDVQILLSTWAYFPEVIDPAKINIYSWTWRQQAANENNAVMRHVAEETGAGYYDFMGNLPHNPTYWNADGHHQTAAGNEEQARQYAAYIVGQGWLER